MLFLVLQEFNLLFSLLHLNFPPFPVSLLDCLYLGLQFDHFILKFGLFSLQFVDFLFKVGFAVFSLQLFAHGEGNRTLIQCLIGSNGHLNLISNSEEEEAALWLVQGHLSNDFVETLGEKLFTHGADAALTGLALHQLLIQHFSQSCHIYSSCFLVTDILDVVFA